MRRVRILGAGLALVLAVPAVAFAIKDSVEPEGRAPVERLELVAELGAYDNLATWVDMYDRGPWVHPERTARRMAARGTKTLFLETSNYKKKTAIYRPASTSRLIEAAHLNGLRVIAWYLPGYDNLARDWRRTRRAITYTSTNGQHFDGFAMDIEATVVRDISTRNRRMITLANRLRDFVGPDYTLGAIIPDPVSQRFWPNFPYRKVHARFDVFMPMAYWTYRTGGQSNVYNYTSAALNIIRSETRDASVPIHIIGGIASDAPTREVRGFARAARDYAAVGASLYDYPITTLRQWEQMKRING